MSSKQVEGFPSVGLFFVFVFFFVFSFLFFLFFAAFAPELVLRRSKGLQNELLGMKFNSRHFFFLITLFFFAVLLLSVNMLICSELSSLTPNSISSREKEEDANFGGVFFFKVGRGARGRQLCLVTEIILVFPPD